jgi:hypothetical protein
MRTNSVAAALVLAALLATFPTALAAQAIEFTTENDLFTDDASADDLYTFAVALEVERHGSTFALREDAFTDREAGLRFDETSWSLGRPLPVWHSWRSHAEAGPVRVGRGIFGEGIQNTVHGALGSDSVTLAYLSPSLHGRAALTAERSWSPGSDFAIGPRLEVEWVSALRSHALLAAQAQWRPLPMLALDLLVGVRWSDADLAALEPHIESVGAAAEIGVAIFDRVRLAWSLNDHGDGRSHLALAYRFARFRSGEGEVVRE